MQFKNSLKISISLISTNLKYKWIYIITAMLFIYGFMNVHKTMPPMLNFINNSGSEMNYVFIIIPCFCFWYAWSMSHLDQTIKAHLLQRPIYVSVMIANSIVNSLVYSFFIGVTMFLSVGVRQGVTLYFFYRTINLYVLLIWILSMFGYLLFISVMMTCIYQFVKGPILTAAVCILLVCSENLISFFWGRNLLVSRLPSATNIVKLAKGGLFDLFLLFIGLIILASIFLGIVVNRKDWLMNRGEQG
ncbi:hypothetical protein MUDAN_DOGOELCO_01519 [Lactiplantibacillus mudanjiangensis]|nr:hypothetical protein MUDAN_DOGOELCO_01519 [Lactiplantibacillus mudanjiangensis]